MRRDVLLVLRGDLRHHLRDPVTLLAMVILPVLLLPLGLWGMGAVERSEARSLDQAVFLVEVPPDVAAAILPEDRLQAAPAGAEGVLARVVRKPGGLTEVHYEGTSPRSRRAVRRVEEVLERLRLEETTGRFQAAGIPIRPDAVVRVTTRDLAPAEERAGSVLGRLLPLVLVLVVANGGMYTALDLFTGERERGTLETLLTSRVDRRAVVLGKFLLVVLFAGITGLLALASLAVFLAAGLYVPTAGSVSLGLGALPVLLVLLAPLAVLLAALLVVMAAYARDFKTGQFMAMAGLLGVLALAGVSAFPALTFTPALALLPVANVALAMREALVDRFPPVPLAITVVATLVHVGVALWAGANLLGKEAALLGSRGSAARRARGRYGPDALILFLVCFLLLWFLGQNLQTLDMLWGMVGTQVLLLAAPAVGILVWLGLPVRENLGLRRPRIPDLLLAVVGGAAAPGLSAAVAALLDPLLPVSSRFLESFQQGLDLQVAIPVLVAVFALLPALCEEVLFRGALLALLRRSLGPVAASLAVGAMFGLIHLYVVRMGPTAVLGVLLAAAALRSRSLWVPVLMHALHNGLLLAGGRGGWLPEDPPLVVLVALGLVSVAAVAAMGRWPGRRAMPEPASG